MLTFSLYRQVLIIIIIEIERESREHYFKHSSILLYESLLFLSLCKLN